MAKLFTGHDPFHIHKILGLLAVLNFAYRFVLIFWQGYAYSNIDTLPSKKQVWFDIATVLLHGALSWSSLLLPLPLKRNFQSPMIWREFRWHSILFATRAVLGTLVSILGLWPTMPLANFAAKLGLVMGTCYAAELATHLAEGCPEKRTTNAMAYPAYLPIELEHKIKLCYSMAQFSATVSCITEDPTASFLSLYAIQGAAFLMTLRRKNWISTRMVHFCYELQLCVGYWPAFGNVLGLLLLGRPLIKEHWAVYYLIGGVHLFAGYWRIDCGHSKLRVWSCAVALTCLFQHHPGVYDGLMWFHSHPVGIAYIIFCHVNEYQRVIGHYSPIFLGYITPSKQKAMQKIKEDNEKNNNNNNNKDKPHYQLRQYVVKELVDNDLLGFPNRQQRLAFVLAVMFATKYRGLEVAKQLVESVVGQDTSVLSAWITAATS